MDVEEFVSQTLQQINRGLSSIDPNQTGLAVVPEPYISAGSSNTAAGHMIAQKGNRPVFFIKFDLSVTVQSKAEGTSGATISVLGIGGGRGEISGSVDQTRVQRIEFSLPVTFVPELKLV